MNYQIAIPSYKRPNAIKTATLATLAKYGVNPTLVTVFVANEKEYEWYKGFVPESVKIVIAEVGKVNAQQFYHEYYPSGTRLVNMDDDIQDLTEKQGDKVVPYSGSFDDLVYRGFELIEKYGSGMWGINPTGNGFYMSENAIVGLRYIIGSLYGNYAGDIAITDKSRPRVSSGDDYETSLRSFLIYGSVVRMDWISFKTKFFATGGIDAEVKDKGLPNRMIEHRAELQAICARYPELASMYWKAGNVPNIRIKAKTYARESRK